MEHIGFSIFITIIGFFVCLLIFKWIMGFSVMIKNQQTMIKLLCEIAIENGVSEDKIDGIKNEVNYNN